MFDMNLLSILKFQPPKNKLGSIRISLFVVFICLLFPIIVYPIKLYLSSIDYYLFFEHPTSKLVEQYSNSNKLIYIVLISVLIRPLAEEISFRYWVSESFNKRTLGLSFLFVFINLIILENQDLIHLNEIHFNLVLYISSFFLVILILFISPVKRQLNLKIKHLAITSAILFGIVHLNVISQQPTIVGYAVSVLPYVISGYLYSYLRVYAGFKYCLMAHSINNLIIFMIDLL